MDDYVSKPIVAASPLVGIGRVISRPPKREPADSGSTRAHPDI
jgi:hypothetical protein